MIKVEMTGICENCDQAELYMWDSAQNVFTHNWHAACKYEEICKRVERLCKSESEEVNSDC